MTIADIKVDLGPTLPPSAITFGGRVLDEALLLDIEAAWHEWCVVVARQGGPLTRHTTNGLPPFDKLELALNSQARNGDAGAFQVLRDRLEERHGPRAYGLLEKVVLYNLALDVRAQLKLDPYPSLERVEEARAARAQRMTEAVPWSRTSR